MTDNQETIADIIEEATHGIPPECIAQCGSDSAKLREALVMFVRAYEQTDEMANIEDTAEAYELARAALAAPPRNCDLARDWMRDLYAHFQPPASIKREMPPEWVDAVMAFCRWLVAPATEQKGVCNDGNE